MRKTDITKLVTAQLKQEFERQQKANEQHSESLKEHSVSLKDCLLPMPLPEAKPTPEEARALQNLSRWHLSFQERNMAKADAAGMLLGHKPEAKPTPEDEFKIKRLSWWLLLFEGRMALGDAAGMLLGFSQTMTKDAKFVDAHKPKSKDPKEPPPKSRAPSRPVSSDLVTAFTDMQARITDWRKTSDGKYEPCELIEWAKEKDFVADEVLNAWEAYIKAEAVKAEQETGNESATTESGQSEQEKVPHAATGMTTREIGAVFDGLPFKAENWPKRASQAKWLSDAKLSLGAKGGASSMWCPFEVAKASFKQASERDRPKRLKDLNNRFKINPALGPWRDVWDKFYSMFNDAD